MRKTMGGLFNDLLFRKRLLKRLQEGWTYEKIEPMSTDEIFAKLNRLGVAVTPEMFREAAQRHDSAQRLADEWYAQYPLYPEGRYDEDFVWMAAIVLRKRLVPERISFEQIDDLMQEGYTLLAAHCTAEACDAWWQVWEWLKEKVTPERDTLGALDGDFRGTQSVLNWCQDFEMELGNAGRDDPRYYQLRIRYCCECLETFPNVGWLMRGNFLRAEAEAHWRLGEIKMAEVKFAALIDENPDWAWGYINWSDLYWLFRAAPKDYDRAEAILERALARPNLEDRGDALDRLEELRAERATVKSTKRRKNRRRRKR